MKFIKKLFGKKMKETSKKRVSLESRVKKIEEPTKELNFKNLSREGQENVRKTAKEIAEAIRAKRFNEAEQLYKAHEQHLPRRLIVSFQRELIAKKGKERKKK